MSQFLSPNISSNKFNTPSPISGRSSGVGVFSGSGSKVIDKNNSKKKQSQIKSFVLVFGKIIINWKSNVDQIEQLLMSLIQLYSVSHSVNKTSVSCNDIENSNIDKETRIFSKFINLGPKILSDIVIDIEAIILEIKKIMRSMGDIIAAMKINSHDSMRLVTDEHPEIFSDHNSIFNTDHVLDMNNIQIQYELEYQRKEKLISNIILIQSLIYNWNEEENKLTNILDIWRDDYNDCYISQELVQSFLLTNNIGD
jgi:hypothetical protein